MEAIVPIALILIVLILAGGVAAGILLRKRQFRGYGELLRQGAGWQRLPADPQLWQRVAVLRWFAGRLGLQDLFHFGGEYRGVRFEAVQYRRPPRVGERVYVAAIAVYLPRPVPGPSLHLARQGQWAPLGQDSVVPTGHPQFDQSFMVTSSDPDFARAVLNPGLVDGLLRDQRTDSCVIEFGPEHVVAFATKVATKNTVLPMLDLVADVHAGVAWQALDRR
ncbi:hypothetical protein [Saccharopolyspora taberi]|uniref:DUF3137 domain-containing protein n=1 Tax=Saccharopolyspora taberi TaxID=60895 RepID=A0ABN3VKZ6_9PSEU